MTDIINKKGSIFKSITGLVLVSFLLLTIGPFPIRSTHAQTLIDMPLPGAMINLSPAFVPPMLRGVKIFPDNPLQFDFIIETGDPGPKSKNLKSDSTKLIKYFLASLTVPEEDLWVNLSPYEKDRIIPEQFGITEMGRDLLAQDYVLKQLTASLLFPGKKTGLKFWNTVYKKANAQFGTTEILMKTFNKVWIVPKKAVVYVKENTAFVAESYLEVMLEEDYLAAQKAQGDDNSAKGTKAENDVSSIQSSVLKEIILPEIEKEINFGKTFAPLRQIYHSMILATWFKRNLRESVLGKIYVEKNKVGGIDIEDKNAKEKIYQQYLEAYKSGVYNFIKEDYDVKSQKMIPRKYFSGGAQMGHKTAQIITDDGTSAQTARGIESPLVHAFTRLKDTSPKPDRSMLSKVFTKRTREGRNNDIINLIRDPRLLEFLKDFGINLEKGRHSVFDFGVGALPFGAVELKKALQEINPHINVLGTEKQDNLASAHFIIRPSYLLDKIKYLISMLQPHVGTNLLIQFPKYVL